MPPWLLTAHDSSPLPPLLAFPKSREQGLGGGFHSRNMVMDYDTADGQEGRPVQERARRVLCLVFLVLALGHALSDILSHRRGRLGGGGKLRFTLP